jgi:hypothetical protein
VFFLFFWFVLLAAHFLVMHLNFYKFFYKKNDSADLDTARELGSALQRELRAVRAACRLKVLRARDERDAAIARAERAEAGRKRHGGAADPKLVERAASAERAAGELRVRVAVLEAENSTLRAALAAAAADDVAEGLAAFADPESSGGTRGKRDGSRSSRGSHRKPLAPRNSRRREDDAVNELAIYRKEAQRERKALEQQVADTERRAARAEREAESVAEHARREMTRLSVALEAASTTESAAAAPAVPKLDLQQLQSIQSLQQLQQQVQQQVQQQMQQVQQVQQMQQQQAQQNQQQHMHTPRSGGALSHPGSATMYTAGFGSGFGGTLSANNLNSLNTLHGTNGLAGLHTINGGGGGGGLNSYRGSAPPSDSGISTPRSAAPPALGYHPGFGPGSGSLAGLHNHHPDPHLTEPNSARWAQPRMPSPYGFSDAGYPPNNAGFPANSAGYPANSAGYPANSAGYPANNGDYAAASTYANSAGFGMMATAGGNPGMDAAAVGGGANLALYESLRSALLRGDGDGLDTLLGDATAAEVRHVPPEDPAGLTLLHLAAQHDLPGPLLALLRCGSLLAPQDARGRTPLEVALESGAAECAGCLRQLGAV